VGAAAPYALLELVIMYVAMRTSALASSSHCRTAREKVALRRWSIRVGQRQS
jgi:hypothetical protein